MNDTEWREEWSRHYDSVQWTSIYVFTTAVTLLLGYAYTNPGITKNPWYYSVGLGFTNLTVYNTASFRELRILLHNDITNPNKREFLTNNRRDRGFYTWPSFLGMFFLLDLSWLNLYWQYSRLSAFCWAVFSMAILGYCAYRGFGAAVSTPKWVTWLWEESGRPALACGLHALRKPTSEIGLHPENSAEMR